MARGRKSHTDPPVEIKVHVPTSVIGKVELALVDPVRGKPTYGSRSKLITRLLRDWLDDVAKGRRNPREITGV